MKVICTAINPTFCFFYNKLFLIVKQIYNFFLNSKVTAFTCQFYEL